MLGWALTFLVIALIAAVLGFAGIAGAAAGIAQILFYIFLGSFHETAKVVNSLRVCTAGITR